MTNLVELRAEFTEQIQARMAMNAAIIADDNEAREAASKRLEAAERALLDAWAALDAPAAPKELADKISLHRYVQAAVEGRQYDGAEAELAQEMKLPTGQHWVPLAALEARADAKTTLTAGKFGSNVRPAILPVYAAPDLAHLGITPQSLPVGTTKIPRIADTNKATPAAKSEVVEAAAATISTVEFNPKEIRKRFRYSETETYEWGDRLEQGLRTILRNGLAERLADMAFGGSGSSNQITGLLNSITAPTAETDEEDWPSYRQKMAGQIEGRFTNSERGMRLLIGIDTIKHMRTKFKSNGSNSDGLTGIEDLGVAVRITSRMPAMHNTNKTQDALIALSEAAARESYFVGVWNSFSLIRDPYSASAAADVSLTATIWYDGKTLTTAAGTGIKRISFKVAA